MKPNEVYFNELSSGWPAGITKDRDALVYDFAACGRQVHDSGFGICRSPAAADIEISPGFTLAEWMSQAGSGRNRQIRDFFYSFLRHPFEKGDEESEIYFMERRYQLDEQGSGFEGKTAEGLAWADIYGTFAVSLKTAPVWDKHELVMSVTEREDRTKTRVKHVSDPGHLKLHAGYIEEMTPPAPLKTSAAPESKGIHLRQDHGVNILFDFARKLVNSEYVTEIINSIPFCPACVRFIRRAYPDGKIELTLNWYDTGYGLVVQTTGKTLRETEYIAEVLDREYGRR